jgi:hypothetical protein
MLNFLNVFNAQKVSLSIRLFWLRQNILEQNLFLLVHICQTVLSTKTMKFGITAVTLGIAGIISVAQGFATPFVSKGVRNGGTSNLAEIAKDFGLQNIHNGGHSQLTSALKMSATVDSTGFNTRLDSVFRSAKERGEAAFVGFITAGYPTKEDTVELMLAMQEGGTSVIELGVPYTDPQADGATIQLTNQIAINGGTDSIAKCLEFVKEAR